MTSTAAASVSTTTTWADCVGPATWLTTPLQQTLHYDHPLPVQQAVIPTVSRAMLSGIPMDVSLTAPTGSGKTLCYLLPLLRLLTEEKKGMDDTQLRALVLVPTKALGQQVFRELQRLTRHTSIVAVSLCAEVESVKEEAEAMVRTTELYGIASEGVGSRSGSSSFFETDSRRGDVADTQATSLSAHAARYHYSQADVLIATPQRLLRHLDSTVGLRLAALRLLVIDEADQVLAGNFANFVSKVVERFEGEVAQLIAAEREAGRVGRDGQRFAGTASAVPQSEKAHYRTHTLHKVLCSATLSSRIARISEVRLRNCRYFALDSNGVEVAAAGGAATDDSVNATTSTGAVVRTSFALPTRLQEHIVFVEDWYRHAVLLKLVKGLLVRVAQQRERERQRRVQRLQKLEEEQEESNENDGEEEGEKKAATRTALSAAKASTASESDDLFGEGYPLASAPSSTRRTTSGEPGERMEEKEARVGEEEKEENNEDDAGTGIVVFCSSAEEARVMGHFLTAGGVANVVEFTTLTTEAERRRALLSRTWSVVVACDALMRGIDIPNVGHVVMYHPPESISQYVHRAGRTARAMRAGHVHLLLSKVGPSGTQADGEVAKYKELHAMVTHTLPPRYERHFFLFAKAPSAKEAGAAATAVTAEAGGSAQSALSEEGLSEGAKVKGSAEWWVVQANRSLGKSQYELQRRWASALEAATTAAGPSRRAAAPTPSTTDSHAGNDKEGKAASLPSSTHPSAPQRSPPPRTEGDARHGKVPAERQRQQQQTARKHSRGPSPRNGPAKKPRPAA